MKAISIKQPWASIIASGKKTIETRTWNTNYRGKILLVSSKKPNIDDLPCGYAIATANLVDCRPMVKSDKKAACCPLYKGAFSWILEDVRAIKPFTVKGMLGIYELNLTKIKKKIRYIKS